LLQEFINSLYKLAQMNCREIKGHNFDQFFMSHLRSFNIVLPKMCFDFFSNSSLILFYSYNYVIFPLFLKGNQLIDDIVVVVVFVFF
jgi:hypothetical protein